MPSALEDRWNRFRVVSVDLNTLWVITYVIAWSSVVPITVSLILLVCRKRLRNSIYNQMLALLMMPDLLFSFFCGLSCFIQRYWGSNQDGPMCVLQSFYITFASASSAWLNCYVVFELQRMIMCPLRLKTYRPPPWHTFAFRILCLEVVLALFSLLVSGALFQDLLPFESASRGGYYCLPLEYDVNSMVLQFCFTLFCLGLLPSSIILVLCMRVWFLAYRRGYMSANKSAVVRVFGIRFLVYNALAGPTMVGALLVPVEGPLLYGTGIVGHVFAVLTSVIALMKPDVLLELRSIYGEFRGNRVHSERVSEESITRKLSKGPGAVQLAKTSSERVNELVTTLKTAEKAPMVVVELETWNSLGHIPRSSEKVTRPLIPEKDIVIFISHRWWSDSEPDDDKNSKYSLLVSGLQKLIEAHSMDQRNVVIWCDWACVEQDDIKLMHEGIDSLISYVANSEFLLIPVQNTPQSVSAFGTATLPHELCNYGERSWCRLETYIYFCVREIQGLPLNCYAFGTRPMFGCWAKQGLRKLPRSGKEVLLNCGVLPSAGMLTCEVDRNIIRTIEENMRSIYCRAAISRQKVKLEEWGWSSIFSLEGKQLSCADVPFMCRIINEMPRRSELTGLNLGGNMLAAEGIMTLMRDVICQPIMSSLCTLSLKGMATLGEEGVAALAAYLLRGCRLKAICLAQCELETKSIVPLAKCMPGIICLTHIDLSQNLIDDAGAEMLFDAAGGSVPKVAIDLEKNRTSVVMFIKVAEAALAVQLYYINLAEKGESRREGIAIGPSGEREVSKESSTESAVGSWV